MNLLQTMHITANSRIKPTAIEQAVEPHTDALAMLGADQRRIRMLIERYRSGADNDNKAHNCNRVCALLSIHILVEEGHLFPAARRVLGNCAVIEEAEIGHYVIKELVRQLQDEELRLHRRDAVFGVLADYVEQHFADERSDLFAPLAASKEDLDELARRMIVEKYRVSPWFGVAAMTTADAG